MYSHGFFLSSFLLRILGIPDLALSHSCMFYDLGPQAQWQKLGASWLVAVELGWIYPHIAGSRALPPGLAFILGYFVLTDA